MIRKTISCALAVLLGSVCFAPSAAWAGGASLDGLAKAIEQDAALSAEQRQTAVETIAQMKARDESSGDIATETMMLVSPAFEDAMTALGEEDVAKGRTALEDVGAVVGKPCGRQ